MSRGWSILLARADSHSTAPDAVYSLPYFDTAFRTSPQNTMSQNPNPGPDAPGPGETAENPDAEPEVVDGQALVAMLVDAEIMLEDEQADDLRLTDGFRAAWWDDIEAVRDGDRARERMAELVDIERDELRFEERGAFVVYHGETELGEWSSRGAFLADLALRPTMAEWLPLWERLNPLSRGELLSRLRAFLETCPVCEGTLAFEDEGDAEPERGEVSLACVDCGSVIVSGEL